MAKKRRGLSSEIDMTQPLAGLEIQELGDLEGALAPPKTIISVPLTSIQPNPDQPRKTFDEDRISDLADSIKDRGILQPLIVRKNADAYLLVAVERRYRAAKKTGLQEVPCILTGDDPLEISLIENVQREDLNPLEEAEAYHSLLERHGYTQEQLATIVRKKRPDITKSLSLNRLPATIKEECSTSNIRAPREILYIISQRSSEDEMTTLWSEYKRNTLTVREIRKRSKPPSRQRGYAFRFVPDGREFSLKITFRKTNVDVPEIRAALEKAIARLDDIQPEPPETGDAS